MDSSSRTIRYGAAVGVIAYGAVAVFYALFDLLASRGVLHTVNQLGRAFFRGHRETASLGIPTAIDWSAIALYNALHFAVSMAIGITVATLVEHAHRRPDRAPVTLLTLIAGFVFTIGIIGAATASMRPVLPWWSLIVANSVAVVLAGWFLMRRYPTVFRRLTDPPIR